MDYEERMIDGVQMVAYAGCWYPVYEDERDYDEKVEDGMIMIFLDGEWHTLMEAQDPFPFADLSDDEMNALYDDQTDARIPVPYYECDDDDMEYFNFYDR